MIEFVANGNILPCWWDNLDSGSRPTGYYFYSEMGTRSYGPFPSKEECQEAMDRYEDHYP